MTSQNKVDQKDSQERHLLITIQSYQTAAFFEDVGKFQQGTHGNQRYVEFQLSNLPVFQDKSQVQNLKSKNLHEGTNKDANITLMVLRAINFEERVFCFVKDHCQPPQCRYFPLVILFTDQQKAQQWCKEMAYLAIIQAFHPYMRLDSFYKGLMLLARHDCIIVKHFKLDYIKNWEMAKQFANEAFKKKKYHDALAYYDIAIGMLWETKSDRYRDRATLYSNASQAFFELNLIQNALLYANTSLSLDRTSIKSLYRKFSALLELGEFSQINSLLPIMYQTFSREEFQVVNNRYTRYMANKTGIFNWIDIMNLKITNFGEYLNSKVILEKHQSSNSSSKYRSIGRIQKYELVAVQRSIMYEGQKSIGGDNFMNNFLMNLYQHLNLKSRLLELIKNLLVEKVDPKSETKFLAIKNSLKHSHRFKTIFLDYSITSICPGYTLFHNDQENPNCTILILHGYYFFFAAKEISPKQPLSAQLFNQIIEQTFPSMLIFEERDKKGLQLYLSHKEELLKKQLYTTALRFLWKLLKDQSENRLKVLLQLLHIMQKYPIWQITIIILCQLYSLKQFPSRQLFKLSIVSLFSEAFKISVDKSSQMLNKLISD